MRKYIIIAVIFFITLAGAIKCGDIINRYDMAFFDYLRYSAPLTEEEEKYLKSSTLLYGIDVNDAPFAFVSDETGQNTGILVDYFNQLSVTLEGDFQPSVAEGINIALRLKDGLTDAAVIKKTKMNENVFLYSQPLYTERSKVLVEGDSEFNKISDISNMSIAVISGSSAHHASNEFFKESHNVRIVLTADLNESFYLFGTEEVDAILGDEAKISYYLNSGIRSNKFKFLDDSILEEDVAIAVNKDQEMLLDILNKGILDMKKNNQYSHIHSKWFGSFVPETNEPVGSSVIPNLIIAALAAIAVLLVWILTVRSQVSQRTRELAESREELRELVDSLRDGIIVTDGDGVVQVCNKSVLDFLGTPQANVLGKKLEDIPELTPFLEKAGGESIYSKDDRDYLIYRRKLNAASNNDLVFIDDYTERHRVENLNSQESKMIAVGELSAGLAHEIRNPLGLIRSYLYVLKKKIEKDDENGQHAISVMDDSADRINSLIENLLGFSRLSMEDTMIIDVKESVESVLSLEEPQFKKRGITVEKKYDLPEGALLSLNGDVLKLCMVNLIQNAIDALSSCDKENKTISIDISHVGSRLYIEVKDNGPGASKDALTAIFNPFYTTKETGTGLGLYILQSELRRIGGTIRAESQEGEYMMFRVSMPVEREVEHDQ